MAEDHPAERRRRSTVFQPLAPGGDPLHAAAELRAVLPLTLLGYLTRIWERHAALQPEETMLPPILPVLLHHGTRPWPWPADFASSIRSAARLQGEFGRRLLDFEFVLDDLAARTDAELLARGNDAIVKLTLLALRNGRTHPRFLELLADALRALRDELRGPGTIQALARLARYVFTVRDEPLDEVRECFAAALAPEVRSPVMTIAERLHAEGRREGMELGRAEARRECLVDQMVIKFGRLDPARRMQIGGASDDQISRWLRRVLTATTLDELFVD